MPLLGVASSLLFGHYNTLQAIAVLSTEGLAGAIGGVFVGHAAAIGSMKFTALRLQQQAQAFQRALYQLPTQGKDVLTVLSPTGSMTPVESKTNALRLCVESIHKAQRSLHDTLNFLTFEEHQWIEHWQQSVLAPFVKAMPGPLGFHQYQALHAFHTSAQMLLKQHGDVLFSTRGQSGLEEDLKERLGIRQKIMGEKGLSDHSVEPSPIRILKR